jgi:hypothetical protein
MVNLGKVFSIFLICLALMGCNHNQSATNKLNILDIQKNMKEYLDTAYEKEFIVEEPKLIGNTGFGYSTYQALAYPKDDPKVAFGIQWNKDNEAYVDSYLNEIWTKQAEEEVNEMLKEYYGEGVILDYEFNFNLFINNVDPREAKNLNHKEIMVKYPDKILCKINIYTFMNDEFDKTTEAKRLFSFLNKLFLERKVESYFIDANYFTKDYKNEFIKRYERIKSYQEEVGFEKLYQEGSLINTVVIKHGRIYDDYCDIYEKFKY